MPPPPPKSGPLPPRVIFFGPPGSGKSTLIEAFVRQATSATGGEAIQLTHAGSAQSTLRRELVPHQILVDNPALPNGAFVLIDCDGQAAGELLDHADKRLRGAARGALADAVRTADALVLVVDAAAEPEAIDRTFRSFGHFLDGLEEGRTFGREVGGLPVFLTLTKCDVLAKPGDAPTDWLARIEDRERALRDRFEDYFGDEVAVEEPSPFLAFGSIDLHPMATAVKTPPGPMFEAYADPDGAFGVAELVRDALPAARAYRRRVVGARKRLRWTLTGVGSFVGAILLGLILLGASGRFGNADQLAQRVRAYQNTEPPAAERLADRNFARNRKELFDIVNSAGFNGLPTDLRKFVLDRLAEFTAYRDYRAVFRAPRLGPAEIQTAEQARELEAALQTDLAPPPEYAAAWADTEAVRLARKWRVDLALLRDAEGQLHNWLRAVIRRGNQLLLVDRVPDASWRSQVTALLAEAETPPFRPEQEVERSPSVPVLRGRKLTYAPAFDFESVEQARHDWQDTRDRLRHLRDLTDATGLTAGGATAVLDLPEPVGDGARDLAVQRLAALRVAFPYPNDAYPEWDVNNFPDPVRQAVGIRLRSIFDTGVRHVRRLILAAHGSAPESVENWRRLAGTVLEEPEMKAWGRLLGLLRRWADPTAHPDPVRELADFLRRDQFLLNFRTVSVTIPNDLLEQRAVPPPGERFVVTVTPAGGSPSSYAFRQEGGGRDERGATTFTFVPDGPGGPIAVRPGDQLTAALPLRAGGQDHRLNWSAGRSAVYQVDRLTQPPRLERGGVNEPAPGVRLAVTPPEGLPAVPALLPDMRR
jgi:hypothetical protein